MGPKDLPIRAPTPNRSRTRGAGARVAPGGERGQGFVELGSSGSLSALRHDETVWGRLPWSPTNTVARAEERDDGGPFELPRSWALAQSRLDADTPYNFVSTNDIIGGNSGSPVINRDGDLVGIVFDGNRYSFLWSTIFSQDRGRSVSVDARAIIETLSTVYRAKALVEEIDPTG